MSVKQLHPYNMVFQPCRVWEYVVAFFTCCHVVLAMGPPTWGPFFYLCNYHGDLDQSTLQNGEIAISVSLAGNPDYYIPGNIYKVTVVSSHDFDGFMMTGVHTVSGEASALSAALPPAAASGASSSGVAHCMHVHNHVSNQPQQTISFFWRAPPTGTGCINFLAMATLKQDVLFKDTTVMQICEEGGNVQTTARPPLADIHEYGLVLRDDFDSNTALDNDLWYQVEGAEMGNDCSVILHGHSLVFCGSAGNRSLATVPLNLTSASVVQFALGSGTCEPSVYDPPIEILYATDFSCTNWTLIEHLRPPSEQGTTVHLLHLPTDARRDAVCLQWRQVMATGAERFEGCWAMDNVVVINRADPPSLIYETFDPIDPTNWIFFPGGHIKHQCRSEKQALVFPDAPSPYNYATTRDLSLDPVIYSPLLSHNFDGDGLQGWIIQGGRVEGDCDSPGNSLAVVFDGIAKSRQLCTPHLNLTSAGSVRFSYKSGGNCQVNHLPRQKSKVYLYAEDESSETKVVVTLDMHSHKGEQRASVPLPPEVRGPHIRLCWIQKQHGGQHWDVWQLDDIEILPLMPGSQPAYLQFSLNLKCGRSHQNLNLDVEYSTDHGEYWFPLYKPCYPGHCPGLLQTRDTKYTTEGHEGWVRHTLPIPLAAMMDRVRFRWRQSAGITRGGWAIDNVFVGQCIKGCTGHGQCTTNGCRCDYGYEGNACERPTSQRPTLLIETMASVTTIKSHFEAIKGAALSYSCGVVASGKAVVFNRDGPRKMQTIELNTTQSRYLQFSLRLGSNSATGECPPPSNNSESVFLLYTCSGGVEWTPLQTFSPELHPEPKVHLVLLPEAAQQPVCQFLWWQPRHSGHGADIWALDDVSFTHHTYNTINLDFNSLDETSDALDVHLGTLGQFCTRTEVLKFTEEYERSQTRYVMTTSMHIGPSYAIQFDLVMGCSTLFSPNLDNKIRLEYSTNHGMTWQLVRSGCHPPTMCEQYHEPTVYDASQFSDWSRVTILLPPSTWSGATRFRWLQTKWALTDSWALDNLYVGQQCPGMCHGRGYCVNGVCNCDKGYHDSSCTPATPLPSSLKTDFTILSKLHQDWPQLYGGEVSGAGHGCGTVLSGESLYFSKSGSRQVVSKDLNTQWADYLQFYIRMGGTSLLSCYGITGREENVLVQYSNDGGITWSVLKELHAEDYREPIFVHVVLPLVAKTEATRFRFWQPSHSGQGTDQWAMDEIAVGLYQGMPDLQDDFEKGRVQSDSPISGDVWLTITEGMYDTYCQSPDNVLMFVNQNNDKLAMTKDLLLRPDDIVQFKINVGCSRAFSYLHPVLLQYSHDSGRSWQLLEKPCHLEKACHGHYSEGSIYYTGTYGEWRLVVIPISQEISKGKTNLRWWQAGGSTSSFAIDDVYIGPPCPSMCNGHGVCVQARCKCDPGYSGRTCVGPRARSRNLIDRFDDVSRPGSLWESVLGGSLSRGCGKIATGNALYFGGAGTREARTVPMDLTHIKVLEFKARIGSLADQIGCRRPQYRNEGVLVQYSIDNGVTWSTMKVLDAEHFSKEVSSVSVIIPEPAKSPSTILRWWQPITTRTSPRAEWAIDDVIIAVNETSARGFQDNFDPMQSDTWYTAMNAQPKLTCNSRSNALEFSKNEGRMRYAETWDFEVTVYSFLQFDIAMGCSGTFSTLYSVQLEFSIDRGKTWQSVQEACLPPAMDCDGYHISSSFHSQSHANWTRVTLYLPSKAISPATRFRWVQGTIGLRGNVWALDNVYLGGGCPWMCSGHGYCSQGTCVCDPGFFGQFCVPQTPLPDTLKDSFDTRLDKEHWTEFYGGEISDLCKSLVSDKSLTFFKDNLRMLVSRDLDVSMATYVQFTFRYGCGRVAHPWPRENSVVLQYSKNGGIKWNLLKLIHFKDIQKPKFFSVQIPSPAKTNATRFRFWQPQHGGNMRSIWSIDDLMIGGSMVAQDSIYETFDSDPHPGDWLFWPGGHSESYCDLNTRSDTLQAGTTSMVFKKGAGERSITTKDLNVNDMSVIQFDLNVGCTTSPDHVYPVRLEYSENQGRTWQLVVPPCSQDSLPSCVDQPVDASLYYAGATPYWRRVTLPLSGLRICGTVRFRWYQGHFNRDDSAPEWAVDNVYIGMQCEQHCLGHGTCFNGFICDCDEGFDLSSCVAVTRKPAHLLEDFDGIDPAAKPEYWRIISGTEISDKCGQLVEDKALVFSGNGRREISTNDLDLSSARLVQFTLRLGCGRGPPVQQAEAVLLQYSGDGGITWRSLESFPFSPESTWPVYIALNLPEPARTNATRIRWLQPTLNGTYLEDWALDQIFIGGDISGHIVVQDDLSQSKISHKLQRYTAWTTYSGSVRQRVCESQEKALLFSGTSTSREAVSTDVTVTESSFLQFHIAMGCTRGDGCYEVKLEYSLDLGRSWHILRPECLQSDVDCSNYYDRSVFSSDTYYGWQRITILLPYYTRSPATRFRWRQAGPPYKVGETWSLSKLYIGDECALACNGHGQCDQNVCRCDRGWSGASCSDPERLPNSLSDDFSSEPRREDWLSVVGGALSAKCGVLVAGTSLHFTGTCRRLLVSRDLDLRSAMFIQFHFKFGCVSAPTSRDEGVLIDYSTNGGTTWSNMMEIYYDQHHNVSYIMVDLPAPAKHNGVRIRWWQPKHIPGSQSDWALDNIVIGGRDSNPIAMQDSFDGASSANPGLTWLQKDNIHTGRYCEKKKVMKGKLSPGENVTLMTAEMSIEEGYILQFTISVGCNTSWDIPVAPVHLEYSTDYGMTWTHLVEECMPFFQECNGEAATASVYYTNNGWQRVTVVLIGPSVSGATRFRWQQSHGESGPSTSIEDEHWAIDDVYIGPACEENCNGRGQCRFPTCHCDKHFNGHNCHRVTQGKTFVKDTFDSGIDEESWSLIQGGTVGTGCKVLVEGTGLHFTGLGQRQAVTTDLDLRNARFVQFYILIGGSSSRRGCGKPKSRNESVVLQYSTDAGIQWHTIHLLDHAVLWQQPQHQYVPLPPAARTAATRVRWFQMISSSPVAVGWTLDNVFIGGSEINPSELYERLEVDYNDRLWEFAPGADRKSRVCEQSSGSMLWGGSSGVKKWTTSQLIIQENYMLQFKIMVSCGSEEHKCNLDQPVVLEFNKDPLIDQWELVYPQCFVNGHEYNMECKPYQYHPGTIYSANTHPLWTRVTLELPSKMYSSNTRLRWIRREEEKEGPSWALDDIYIGEKCPNMCNGRGDCQQGRCLCDRGYIGEACVPVRTFLPSHMIDGFEGGVLTSMWASVSGGAIGLGCGALLPFAHGKTLYFNGCGLREAVTTDMDTTKASKIMFVLQIGSHEQSDKCNAEVSGGRYGIVLLQYTANKGIDWYSIASHEPHEFLTSRRVAYDIPEPARAVGIQFRWWQPEHRGTRHDQWAIDYIEIIMTRKEQMLRTIGGHRRHGNLLSYSRNLVHKSL